MLNSQSGAESAETGRSLDGGAESADPTDETVPSVSPAAELDEHAEASSPPREDGAGSTEPGMVPTFLHEIARTMQGAADRERERIAAKMADGLGAHAERVRTRASAEAEELRRLAEEDMDLIREWSATEAGRLRRETESRIGARREDLERHLRQHDALVEGEISRAREAVEEYLAELDGFVRRLASERDPTEIARMASLLPEPPRVEEIELAARADAIAQMSRSDPATDLASAGAAAPPSWQSSTTEGGFDLVGVMDPRVVSQTAGQKAQEGTLAQIAYVSSQDEQVGQERQGRILGARSRAYLVIRLVPVLGLALIIAILVLLVMTGQATSEGARTPGQPGSAAGTAPAPGAASAVRTAAPIKPTQLPLHLDGSGSDNSAPIQLLAGRYVLVWSASSPTAAACMHKAALEAINESMHVDLADGVITASISGRQVFAEVPAGQYYVDVNSECDWSLDLARA